MGLSRTDLRFNLASYLDWEAGQTEKHEFHLGEVFAMVGARLPHNTVSLNIAAALKAILRGSRCRTYGDGTKLHIEAADAVLYPDVMVTCDPRDHGPEDRFLAHPLLVVEVLSESTAAYDRGAKFALYRKLESLRHYLLVDPNTRQVELFSREVPDAATDAATNPWLFLDFSTTDQVTIDSLGVSILLAEIFEDLDNKNEEEGRRLEN